MTREEMLAFVEAVLERVKAPHAVAVLSEDRLASVRFGQNRITQNMDTFTRELFISVGDGSRRAEYTSHRIDTTAIPEIVKTAERLLEGSAADPEYMPPVEEGQIYPVVEAWDEQTAAAEPAPRIGAATAAIESAGRAGIETAGLASMAFEKTALATSTGNLAWHQATESGFQLTMHAGTGSSYVSTHSTAWSGIPVSDCIEQVVEEAVAARDPGESPPGIIDVVLEPQAVADIMPFILMALNARTSDEGITVFSGMEGESVASERFTLRSEFGGPVPGRPFDREGLACSEQVWIEKGVVRAMHCDRYWARKTGRPAVPSPSTYGMDGDAGTAADLAAISSRCIRIRRLWYIRFVDQKSLELTGMTRDGVFLYEGGSCRPVKDFRWNWKPLDLFSRIEALGKPVRKGWLTVPPVLVGGVKI